MVYTTKPLWMLHCGCACKLHQSPAIYGYREAKSLPSIYQNKSVWKQTERDE